MSNLKPKGLINDIPIKTKYKDIIKYVKDNINHLQNGKIAQVDLDYASESSNLIKALNRHTGKRFTVSVRTKDNSVTGYIKLITNE